MENGWENVGTEADFSEKIKLVEVGKTKIALARLNGEIYAFYGLCPHASGPMHRAEVEGTIVTCPLHAWRFDLKDKGRDIHDYRPLRVYEVRVDEGEVFVRV